MEKLDLIILLFTLTLSGVTLLCLTARKILSKLREIATSLSAISHSSDDIAQIEMTSDIEEKIKAGELNKAILLYRSRHDVSLRQAELAIRKHMATLT